MKEFKHPLPVGTWGYHYCDRLGLICRHQVEFVISDKDGIPNGYAFLEYQVKFDYFYPTFEGAREIVIESVCEELLEFTNDYRRDMKTGESKISVEGFVSAVFEWQEVYKHLYTQYDPYEEHEGCVACGTVLTGNEKGLVK